MQWTKFMRRASKTTEAMLECLQLSRAQKKSGVLQLNSCISNMEFCVCYWCYCCWCCSVGRESERIFSHSKRRRVIAVLPLSFVWCSEWFFFIHSLLACLSNSFHFYHWYLLYVCFLFLVSTSRLFLHHFSLLQFAHTLTHTCSQTPLERRVKII